jgi:inorganic pyrophosphatase
MPYIEIVPTDAVKYELDKWSGHLRVDRRSVSPRCRRRFTVSFRRHTAAAKVAELCELRTGRSGIEGDHDPMDYLCVV